MIRLKKTSLLLMCLIIFSGTLVQSRENIVIDNYTSTINIKKNRSVVFESKLDLNFQDETKEFNFTIPSSNKSDLYKINDLKTTEEKYRLLKKGSETTLKIFQNTPFPKQKQNEAQLVAEKSSSWDFPAGPVVETVLPMQGTEVQSLVRELTSHMPQYAAKKVLKK